MVMWQEQTSMRWRQLAFSLMAVVFLLDQFIKWLMVSLLEVGQSVALAPGVFHLTLVKNSGVAFSLFQDYPRLLVAVTGLFIAGFLWFFLNKPRVSALEGWGFGLILGGALGNYTDRLLSGEVTDYLDVTLIQYPVFNFADTAIFIGMLFLVIQLVWGGRRSSNVSSGS